jgi:hypothetical protein
MTEPTTDVAVAEPRTSRSFDDRRALCAALAQSDIAPAHFRNRPANVLLVSLAAEALDLDLFTAMQELYVVQGKIGMSAGLTATLVRKAGHRLRVLETTATTATVEIVRHDDPEAPFRVTWTMEDAKRAGLSGGSWNKYPAAMLVARATTAAARLACPEALSGVGYTPEELGQDEHLDSGSGAPAPSAGPGVGSAGDHQPSGSDRPSVGGTTAPEPDIIDAEIIPDEAPVEVVRSTHADPGEWATDSGAAGAGEGPAAPEHDAAGKTGMWITDPQCKAVNAKARKIGANSTADRNDLVSHLVGRPITTLRDLTMTEASALLDRLKWLEKDEGLANDTWAEIGRGQAASS